MVPLPAPTRTESELFGTCSHCETLGAISRKKVATAEYKKKKSGSRSSHNMQHHITFQDDWAVFVLPFFAFSKTPFYSYLSLRFTGQPSDCGINRISSTCITTLLQATQAAYWYYQSTMADLRAQKIPQEVLDMVIKSIIWTPTIFFFDLVVGAPRLRPPLLPQSAHMKFQPRVNPPTGDHPGTYESIISKTIRSLRLTSRRINTTCLEELEGCIRVPTISEHAVVRFNPRVHIICIHDFRVSFHQSHYTFSFQQISWVKREADLWTSLDFDIDHLALMHWRFGGCLNRIMEAFLLVFPTLGKLYSVYPESPRRNPSEHIDIVLVERGEKRHLSESFLFWAARQWRRNRSDNERAIGNPFVTPYKYLPLEGVVLI
jgi:hypothetical protein